MLRVGIPKAGNFVQSLMAKPSPRAYNHSGLLRTSGAPELGPTSICFTFVYLPLPLNRSQLAHQGRLVPRIERPDMLEAARGVPDIEPIIEIRAADVKMPEQVC